MTIFDPKTGQLVTVDTRSGVGSNRRGSSLG